MGTWIEHCISQENQDDNVPAQHGVRKMGNPTNRVAIGQTNLEVTRLSLGTAPIGNLLWEVPEADAQGAFKAALNAGIRYIDTAPFMAMALLKTAWAGHWQAKSGMTT